MPRFPARCLSLLAALCLAPGAARAVPLQIVNVGAPAINCVFNTSCSVTVNDHSAPLWGAGFLQSRTYQGAPGSPAAGMWAYVYRIDLTRVTTGGSVTELAIDFGPVVNTLDFNGDGSTGEQVWVTTEGGLGSVAPVSAEQTGRVITFRFTNPPVSGGSANGGGQTTYFFGLVSRAAPAQVNATLATSAGAMTLEARAPNRGLAVGRPPVGRPPLDRAQRPLRPIAAEDCLPYDPRSLTIADEGANGWLLTDGGSRMLMLDNQADAERALAVARAHTAHCFIGRGNSRPDRYQYVTHYWTGDSGLGAPMSGEDCISYGPASVGIFDRGALGWRLEDGSSWLLLFDNQADGNRGLTVARTASRLCFIGRGNSRPDRQAYIVEYWR